MIQILFYALLAATLLLYFMRGLLMAGYDNIKYKNNLQKTGTVAKSLVQILIRLKPLLQRKLVPKGVDYKVYARFQKKSMLYYVALWICLFFLLFAGAKLYLNAF